MNKFEWRFFGLKNSSFKFFVSVVFLLLTALVFWWMYHNYYYVNPFVPSDSALRGTDLYGRTLEGDLLSYCRLFLIETAIVLLVLLPFSYRRLYWIRVLVLQVLFGFWFFLLVLIAMHSSSLFVINIAGVLGINVLLSILLISSVIADVQNRKSYGNLWNHQSRMNN